jgi:hypothetical protein
LNPISKNEGKKKKLHISLRGRPHLAAYDLPTLVNLQQGMGPVRVAIIYSWARLRLRQHASVAAFIAILLRIIGIGCTPTSHGTRAKPFCSLAWPGFVSG